MNMTGLSGRYDDDREIEITFNISQNCKLQVILCILICLYPDIFGGNIFFGDIGEVLEGRKICKIWKDGRF